MWGKRNKEQLYEYGRVTVVNANGTLDVLIPGRAHPYKELPSLIDPRIHRVGMSVVVGKAYGNPYMPFVIGDMRSYKTKYPSDFVPVLVVALYGWSTFRSNPLQNFLSGRPGLIFPINYGEDGDLEPVRMENVTNNGAFMGLLCFNIDLDGEGEETEEIEVLAVKNANGNMSPSETFRDEFYSFPTELIINEDNPQELLYESRIADLATSNAFWYHCGINSYHYSESLSKLILIKNRAFAFGTSGTFQNSAADASQIIVIDALTGNTAAGSPEVGGSIVTATAKYTKGYMIDSGCVIAAGTIVKTFQIGGYTHNYSTDVTTATATSDLNGKIVCFDIMTGTDLWSWDPNMIWNGATIPFLREIVPHEMAGPLGSGVNTSGRAPDNSAYPWRQGDTVSRILNNDTGVWPVTARKNVLLPANNGVYNETLEQVVIALSGALKFDESGVVWENPGFDSLPDGYEVRGRYANNGGPALSINNYHNYPYFTSPFNEVDYWYNELLTSGVKGAWVKTKRPKGSMFMPGDTTTPTTQNGLGCNNQKITAFIVSLNSSVGAEERVAWKYQLPEIEAIDHYLIDYDSFSKTSNYADDVSDVYNSFIPSPTSVSVVPSSSVVHPDQIYTATASFSYEPPYKIESRSATQGIMGEFNNYMYWPFGANYMFDPVFYSATGDNSITAANGVGFNLIGDNDGNIYTCYLRPFLIISAATIRNLNEGAEFESGPINDNSSFTVVPNDIDIWQAWTMDRVTDGTSFPVVVTTDYDVTIYGHPNKFVCWKSFLMKLDNQGNLKWNKELTTYHDEKIDSSPGLDGQIPYPGCTLRMIPTSAGLFILRLERLSINTSLREAALFPKSAMISDWQHHTFNSKAVLELRTITDGEDGGEVIWKQTIFDSTSIAPAYLVACSMFGSESTDRDAGPWVCGRVDFSRNHDLEKIIFQASPDFGAGLFRHSVVFTCDGEGNLEFRNAINDDEFSSIGVFPPDYVNTANFNNGIVRQKPGVLMGGIVHYPYEGEGIYSYGNDIPPV